MLTLTEARKTGRLKEFATQEELRGIPSIAANEFDQESIKIIKSPPPQDQTSGSRDHDSSSGKKTP